MNLWIIICSFAFSSLLSFAAPMPATSTSGFLKTDIGFYKSKYGFTLSAAKTNWKIYQPPLQNSKIEILFRGEKKNFIQPSLSARVTLLKKRKNLNTYIKKWFKDYPRFGFKILKYKKIKIKNNIALLIDIVDKKSQKQIRQVVFIKDKISVVLSCRSHIKDFDSVVKNCNRIIKNFRWARNSN